MSKSDDHILEIGPSLNPLAPKREDWHVRTIDHATQDDLVAKYAGADDLDTAMIEEVDFVWQGGTIDECIPQPYHGTFDACLASHVIEHIPDFVGFFRSLATVLKDDGTISMAVPDKRFCFDYFRPHSTTGAVLAAHFARASRHDPRALFDYFAYACTNDGAIAWDGTPPGDLRFSNAAQGLEIFDLDHFRKPSAQYEDCHGWQFTPSSFSLLILELGALDLIDFRVRQVYHPEGCEFAVHLQKGRNIYATVAELDDARRGLLNGIILELGEQADLLRASLVPPPPEDGPPAPAPPEDDPPEPVRLADVKRVGRSGLRRLKETLQYWLRRPS